MTALRTQMRYMNPYDIHKVLINEYILRQPGDTRILKKQHIDVKTDNDILKENHKFLWDDEPVNSWESQFAKKYYDKLFKEYCIGDLSRYKENKIALRWRTEKEVVIGKGQFICGNKQCNEKENLRTYEVNFGYVEQGEKKNALVKIRLCTACSLKLNYHSKKREIKRLKNTHKRKTKQKHSKGSNFKEDTSNSCNDSEIDEPSRSQTTTSEISHENSDLNDSSHWDNITPSEMKSREDEMEEYLQDLLL